MPRVSVFTAAAFAVFAVGLGRNAGEIAEPYERGLLVFQPSGQVLVILPGLIYVVVVMNLLLGIRLYTHAWVLDESPAFRAMASRLPAWRRTTEWLLRTIWVGGTALLPECSETMRNLRFHYLGVHFFFFAVMLCVAAWDILMIHAILGYTKVSRSELLKNLLVTDIIMAVSMAIPWLLIECRLYERGGNWSLLLVPAAFSLCCVVSTYQLVFWGGGILREARSFQ
jgi:hypothetical protein